MLDNISNVLGCRGLEMEDFISVLYFLMYALELFFVGEFIFHNKVKKPHRYVLFALLYVVVILYKIIYISNLTLFCQWLLYIFLFTYLFQGKPMKQISRGLGVYLYTSLVEYVVLVTGYFLLKSFHVIYVWSAELGFALVVLALIPVFCVFRGKTAQKFISYFGTLTWFPHAVVALIAISCLLLLYYCMASFEHIGSIEETIEFFTVILILGLIFAGIGWFVVSAYRQEYYRKQNQLKEEMLHFQQKYYQNIIDSMRELKNFRHDIRSQLGCMQILLSEGKIKQTAEHLKAIEQNLEKTAVCKYQSGNEILDIILSQSIAEAEEKGVGVQVKGVLKNSVFLDSYDLCTIFSNAVHNAVEACEQMPEAEKTIQIQLLEHRKTTFFRFLNPATPEMYENVKSGITGKDDQINHGFGLENIRAAVEKNGGEMSYQYQDKKLALEIYFYN